VNLNKIRKTDRAVAGLIARQLMNNVMVQSGIPFDLQTSTTEKYDLLDKYL
jgi:hypothetical protein